MSKYIYLALVVSLLAFGQQPAQAFYQSSIPRCAPSIVGVTYVYVNFPCSCQNGGIVTNKSEYAACNQLLTCWDGSLAPIYSYCPRVPSGCYLNQYTGDTSCMNNQTNPSQSSSGSSYYYPTYSYSTYGYSTYYYPNNSNYGYYDGNIYSAYNYGYNTPSNYSWEYYNSGYYYR